MTLIAVERDFPEPVVFDEVQAIENAGGRRPADLLPDINEPTGKNGNGTDYR